MKRRYEKPLTPRRWNEAFIHQTDSGPRAKVYRPDYPKADGSGRAFRAHVVWWLKHKKVPPRGYIVHHINENTLEDHGWNLTLMTRSDHSQLHHEKTSPVSLTCAY